MTKSVKRFIIKDMKTTQCIYDIPVCMYEYYSKYPTRSLDFDMDLKSLLRTVDQNNQTIKTTKVDHAQCCMQCSPAKINAKSKKATSLFLSF